MDMDLDGKLSIADLKKACRKLNIYLTSKDLQEIMKEADINCTCLNKYFKCKMMVENKVHDF